MASLHFILRRLSFSLASSKPTSPDNLPYTAYPPTAPPDPTHITAARARARPSHQYFCIFLSFQSRPTSRRRFFLRPTTLTVTRLKHTHSHSIILFPPTTNHPPPSTTLQHPSHNIFRAEQFSFFFDRDRQTPRPAPHIYLSIYRNSQDTHTHSFYSKGINLLLVVLTCL